MQKNYFVSLLGLFALLIASSAGTAAALSIAPDGLPPTTDSGLFFGQNHYYSVIFRGNGEAVVFGKIVVTNTEDSPLDELSLDIGGALPTDFTIFQLKAKPVCIQYDYQKPLDLGTRQYPCLQYQEPDHTYNYYSSSYPYPGNQTEYKKLQYHKTGNLYRFTLAYPIETNKTGAVIFAYAAHGYVKKTAGLFKFNFETPKVPARITQLRVAVDVDSDLYLKGKRAQVNYNTPDLSAFSRADSIGVGAPAMSQALDQTVSRIGSTGPLVKEAKNLSPNESFTVKGEYATSRFRLYLGGMLKTVLAIAVIFALIYWLYKRRQKRKLMEGPPPSLETLGQSETKAGGISIVRPLYAGLGLMSVLLAAGLTQALRYLSEAMDTYFYRYGFADPFFGFLLLIFVVLLYILAIFGPASYAGIKHGWKGFLSVMIAEVLWFTIVVAAYFWFLQSGLYEPPSSTLSPPVPLYYE